MASLDAADLLQGERRAFHDALRIAPHARHRPLLLSRSPSIASTESPPARHARMSTSPVTGRLPLAIVQSACGHNSKMRVSTAHPA